MVGDEQEGLRQPATLLRVVAGPIGPGDLGGQGAHGPGVRHDGPVGAVLVRPVPNILAPEFANCGAVVGPAVHAGAAHAVLIAHNAQRVDLVAKVVHLGLRNARRCLLGGTAQQLADARQLGLGHALGLRESPLVRDRAPPLGHLLRDDRGGIVGERVVPDGIQVHDVLTPRPAARKCGCCPPSRSACRWGTRHRRRAPAASR